MVGNEQKEEGEEEEVGWLVGWLVVSPGRWFPFLSRAGPSPFYRRGEPALVIEVIVRVVLEVLAFEPKSSPGGRGPPSRLASPEEP